MIRVSTALGVIAMAGAAGVARGDDAAAITAVVNADARPLRVGVFGGLLDLPAGIELGNAVPRDQVPQSSFAFGGRVGVKVLELAEGSFLSPRLWIEGEFRAALSRTEGNPARMRASYGAPILGGHLHGLMELFGDRDFSPFAVVGVATESVVSDSPFITNDTDLAAYWGVGARFAMAKHVGLRTDFRHVMAPGRVDLTAHAIEFNIGGYFEFAVGTGRVEVFRQIQHVDVVPPPPPEPKDSDGDGINDPDDACPNQAETLNEIDDSDGCPEYDTDGDGMLGSRDACPDAAEDVDGFEDNDGCPDTDNDGDGQSDQVDQCPSEAETINGFEDDDGCPDELPAALQSFTGVIDGIAFDSGKAKIRASARKPLDKAAAILNEYPSVRIRVSGHTDNTGSRDANLALSLERCESVKAYLVTRGVDASRIETQGVGPDRPIADETSAAGRAKNRRIEFEVIPSAPRANQ